MVKYSINGSTQTEHELSEKEVNLIRELTLTLIEFIVKTKGTTNINVNRIA